MKTKKAKVEKVKKPTWKQLIEKRLAELEAKVGLPVEQGKEGKQGDKGDDGDKGDKGDEGKGFWG